MAIQNGTLMAGATGLTVTGGTSKSLTLTSQKVTNGINVKDMSVTDARLRPSWSFSATPAVYDAKTGLWSKAKKTASLSIPYLPIAGQPVVHFPVIRTELGDFPDMSVAAITEHILLMAQCLSDADFVQFWLNGALS